MSRQYKTSPSWEGESRKDLADAMKADVLLNLQCDILEALESANHPCFEEADSSTGGTKDQRWAWVRKFGPMTNVEIPS
jgi:hypothetical protein